MTDWKKFALTMLGGEQADESIDGICRKLFENHVSSKGCFDIISEEDDDGDVADVEECMKAMVAAGYDSKEVLQLALDDENTCYEDVIRGASECNVSLPDLIAAIKTHEGDDLEEYEVVAIMTNYNITDDSDLLVMFKDLYPDLDDFDEFLRGRDIKIDKRISIMAKALGII